MLDTNVVSHIMQGRDTPLLARLTALVVGQVVISSVTLAELEYGIHRKAGAVRLRSALTQLLQRVDVLPWDEKVATVYGELCATMESQGIKLSDFDMMIAAHAASVGATLVSRDKAFQQVPQNRMQLQIW
jgi:tRNA(fMet)-specific endonuclease VapC